MIEIKNLNKYYKAATPSGEKFHALKDINLTVEDGELLAICGTSGAGKSTLLHIIGLLDRFDSGSYHLDGIDVGHLKDSKSAELRNSKIGFVMQDFALIEHKTVLENTAFPLFFGKTPYKKIKSMAEEVLDKVGISDHIDKKVNTLSGGQKQRVAIARALITNPSFILADEPTGALDSATSSEIMQLMKSLNSNGKTIIIITHDQAIADECKRIVMISDGKIIEQN